MAEQVFAEVIGDPIAHSKSPLIHRFWLDAAGIEGDYRKRHVTAEGLATYFAERRDDPDWRGCNVTVPHKLAALDHVPDPGGVRQTIGATNTVFRGDGGDLIATNTDAAGFYAPLEGIDLADREIVVIGAGGAARAVLFALGRMAGRGDRPRGSEPLIGRVTILNRSPLKAAALLALFGLKGQALQLGSKLPPAALLVNASSLGMAGQPPLSLDLSPLPDDAVVYDAVYAPLETPLLAQARGRGLETIDGLEMLVAQAAIGFELFFGQAPPSDRDDELRALLTV
ncbi:shikimate dehydrogenase family protein [Sphingomonas sp.]|uniref:shikimate dehydrogenase family protein n=1 Tax=Sphingomonas sp. TaxID=28214 RepID=UPI0035BBE28A